MLINPVNIVDSNKNRHFGVPAFGHDKNNYNINQKALIATTSALGVTTAMVLLAKHHNMKLFTKKYEDSYFKRANYASPVPIISIGAGSILGGLVGGCIVDKNKENRKAKEREALLQMGNVAIPILTVDLAVDHLFAKASDLGKGIAGIAGMFVGVALANIVMNKLNNIIFKNKDERGVKLEDYSAHVDDMLASASYISKSELVNKIARIIPFALMVPGNEVGNKVSK